MLLIGKQYEEEKIRLYHCQNGKCPLCGRDLETEISKNQLDHDHALEGPNAGKVRALLCIFCNVLEGQIKHKFNSSGLASRGVDYAEWINNLYSYYRMDLSENPIHPSHISEKTSNFSKLNKPEMLEELTAVEAVVPEKTTKAELVKLYRKYLRKFLSPKKATK